MKSYKITWSADGYDCINAESEEEAKEKFKNDYRQPKGTIINCDIDCIKEGK